MKIRNGFVSNSSSSSFVVFGNEVFDIDIDKKYWCEGTELCDGYDCFELESKAFRILVKLCDRGDFKVISEGNSRDSYYLNMDYGSTETLSDFINRYGDILKIDNNILIEFKSIAYSLNKEKEDILEEKILKYYSNIVRKNKLDRIL